MLERARACIEHLERGSEASPDKCAEREITRAELADVSRIIDEQHSAMQDRFVHFEVLLQDSAVKHASVQERIDAQEVRVDERLRDIVAQGVQLEERVDRVQRDSLTRESFRVFCRHAANLEVKGASSWPDGQSVPDTRSEAGHAESKLENCPISRVPTMEAWPESDEEACSDVKCHNDDSTSEQYEQAGRLHRRRTPDFETNDLQIAKVPTASMENWPFAFDYEVGGDGRHQGCSR
jgi:hypothetical protein